MSGCTIQSNKAMEEWKISKTGLQSLYNLMYLNHETGGKFTFPVTKNHTINTISSDNNIHVIKGSRDSVEAPKGLANFHTHPISCYIGEKTVFGWFSGKFA